MALLHYCQTLWLSCAKVLDRVFELKKEIVIFLSDSINRDDAILFCNKDFIQKLACWDDIFEKLSNLIK